MTKFEYKYLNPVPDRYGKTIRYYFRRPKGKNIPLPGKWGTLEFHEAYLEAEKATRPIAENRYDPRSMTALVLAYYKSDGFQALQPQTQHNYKLILERFCAKYGKLPANRMTSKNIRELLDKTADKPGATSNLLKRLRGVFEFGVERNLIAQNPTLGVKFKRPKSTGFRAWTDDDIAKFKARWPEGSRERLALYLLLYTGQRRSDVHRMGRQHLQNGAISFSQKKGDKPLIIPLHPALKAELDRHPKTNMTFIVTERGKGYTKESFSAWFSECAKAAGLPEQSSPHGLRKAASRMLAEAGCTTHEIAAITGHTSLKEIERYTQSVRQHQMAQAAISKIEDHR